MCQCCEEIDFWKEQPNKRKEMKVKIVVTNNNNTGTIITKCFDLFHCPMCR